MAIGQWRNLLVHVVTPQSSLMYMSVLYTVHYSFNNQWFE